MSAPLRIAHFTVGRCNPGSANGIDQAVACLSRAQARLGHAVSVFSLTAKEPLTIGGVEVYCHGGRVGRLRRATGRGLDLGGFALPSPLVHHMLAWRPDVLHLHSVHIPQNIALAARVRRAGIPYAVTVHGGLTRLIRRRHRWRKAALQLLVERRYLRSAAFLHAVSSRDAEGIRAYGLDGVVSVVPNGLDLGAVPEVYDPRLLKDRYPEIQDRRVFLFLGRLDPVVKGLDLLLQAFARVDPSSAALVLVGPGRPSHQQALHDLTRQLGLDGAVVFTGPAYGQLKFDLLAGADVFVHPSRSEGGLPFSVLEAAAMRKACLVTPAADPAGALSRNEGGITVAPDVESLAGGMRRFLALDPIRLARMGANARSMVEREFDWEPIATRIVGCYRTFALGRP